MNYSDLKLSKWIKIKQLMQSVDNQTDILDLKSDLICIIYDIDNQQVMDMPLDLFSEYCSEIEFLKTNPEYVDVPDKLVINGHRYWIQKNGKTITAGQYIDYQSYLKANKQGEYMPYMLSVFVIPEGHRYNDGYDIGTVINDMNDMSVLMASSIFNFFATRSKRLINNTLRFLALELKMIGWTMSREKKEMLKEAVRKIQYIKDGIG